MRKIHSKEERAVLPIPLTKNFDALIVGYYENGKLLYASRTRHVSHPRRESNWSSGYRGLQTSNCPFSNLPEKRNGRWSQGLTAAKRQECRWLEFRFSGARGPKRSIRTCQRRLPSSRLIPGIPQRPRLSTASGARAPAHFWANRERASRSSGRSPSACAQTDNSWA